MNVLEMKCLRNLVRLSLVDLYILYIVRNEDGRRRAGIERELSRIADHRVLRWFGHVETID